LVLEEIARGGFSLDVDIIENTGKNDIFVQKVAQAFDNSLRRFLPFLGI
jgi:hypothetical protein